MKHYLFIAALALCTSCVQKKSEKVEQTEEERYSIVYNGEKYGIYDNAADSLVTALKYDTIVYRKTTMMQDIEVVQWDYMIDGHIGMLSVTPETNDRMEFTLPN